MKEYIQDTLPILQSFQKLVEQNTHPGQPVDVQNKQQSKICESIILSCHQQFCSRKQKKKNPVYFFRMREVKISRFSKVKTNI